MIVQICVGSSCHIKGSRQVVEGLQRLIADNNLGNKVEIGGTFCMGQCQKGVCVAIEEQVFSVTPETVETFFEQNVLGKA